MMARVIFRAVGVLLTALVLSGCGVWDWITAHDPQVQEPPCTAQSQFWCGDGTGSCCDSTAPLCKADDVGPYCEPYGCDPNNPDCPLQSGKTKKRSPRHYARRPGT